MPVPLYYFSYKNADGTTYPITINEWAEKTLTGADLTNCRSALTRQSQFKTNLTGYLNEYVFPYTNDNQVRVANVPDYSELNEAVIYRFYNFTDYLIDFELNHLSKEFNIDMATIDSGILSRYKHTLKARLLTRYLNWYLGTNGASYPPTHLILKYNGTNAAELGLTNPKFTGIPGLFTTPPVFPDTAWDQYWDKFLTDPNVSITNP
jgi:hypothetical protein